MITPGNKKNSPPYHSSCFVWGLAVFILPTVASHCNFPRLDNRKNSVDLIVLRICRQRPASIYQLGLPLLYTTSNYYKFQCLFFFFFLSSFKFSNPEEFKITTRQITLFVNINLHLPMSEVSSAKSFGNLKRICCNLSWFEVPHSTWLAYVLLISKV